MIAQSVKVATAIEAFFKIKFDIFIQVTKYLQAIIHFRMGLRRNNSSLLQSSTFVFKGIFHGRRHPIYSLIEVNEAVLRRVCRASVAQFLDSHEAVSKSGDPSKGQDFDFILEETNSETKHWIPRGVPTDQSWQQVCRNLDLLKEVKEKVKDLSGVKPAADPHKYRELDVDASVHALRCRLRDTKYLLESSLEHNSITGKPLHRQLSSFRRLAEAKRSNHISALYFNGEEDVLPVFVTEKEEQEATAISNQTIPEIKKRILNSIDSVIGDPEDRTYFIHKYDQVKSKKKADLLKLYDEILNHDH